MGKKKEIIMPNLTAIVNPLHHECVLESWAEFLEGTEDILGVFVYMDNTARLRFVLDNLFRIKEMGQYEKALFHAYTGTRTNFSRWPLGLIKFMFNQANPEKLQAAGEPIPKQENFTLYRGVSGRTRKRRVNGFSWTESPYTAAWFAMRLQYFGDDLLIDPAVFTVTVPRESILARAVDRQESEYLLKLPLPVKPKRLKIMPEPYLLRDKE